MALRGALVALLATVLLAGCSSGPDEDAWRHDLDEHGAGYGDKVWEGYRDAWVEACKADDLQPLIDRVHTETMVLHRTWAQARINVEHACPDRVDELAKALG